MNTYRRAHDFDFPHEPGLMEVLLCLIVDIRMIYPSLDPALALLIKLYRDSICILHQERGISHEYSKKDGSYFARETIHDAGFVWVVLKYVLGHFPHSGYTVRGLREHLVVQVLAVERALEEHCAVRISS